jgi:5S rRNA maturation endonuclease (ribonuclease M5)
MRAIGKITNEFYIILEGKNDLKNALKEAVEESI